MKGNICLDFEVKYLTFKFTDFDVDTFSSFWL